MLIDKNTIQGILPAVTFETTDAVLKVAEIFIEEGLCCIEVPLRTSVALEAITLLRKNFENQLTIGTGTILNERQLKAAISAGAEFGLAPGLNRTVVTQAQKLHFLFIPGVMTPSEMEAAIELNCLLVKVFPMEQIGGVKFLQAMEGPYAHTGIRYIPMGGVGIDNMDSYLSLKQVAAVGGSWLAGKKLLKEKNYEAIRAHVKEAMKVVNRIEQNDG